MDDMMGEGGGGRGTADKGAYPGGRQNRGRGHREGNQDQRCRGMPSDERRSEEEEELRRWRSINHVGLTFPVPSPVRRVSLHAALVHASLAGVFRHCCYVVCTLRIALRAAAVCPASADSYNLASRVPQSLSSPANGRTGLTA